MKKLIVTSMLLLSSQAFALSIDNSCDDTREKIELAFKNIKTNEFQCLKKLNRLDFANKLAAIIDHGAFNEQLQEKRELEISCFDDTSFMFGQLAPNAYATLPSDKEFPAIDVNRFYNSTINRSTIFHELFHLLGYDHQGETLEIAYACKFACDESEEQSERKLAAMRICSGKYESVDDTEYIKDLKVLSEGYGL